MPRKGIDVLLRGLQSVKASGLPFSAHIVGGGPLLEKHRTLLESLHLSDRVTIHGIVPNIDEYLGQADIFVLPSREEQSGSLAMIEAMRAGVACVASACDGIPEDVTHLSDAWLTTPGNHQSLADGIIALLKDSCLRNRIANAGRNTFKRRFSGGAFSQALDSVYRNTLSD
jgi:glycosyltransferase involved in cell wall biosynthesis